MTTLQILVSMVSKALSLPHNSVESARTTRSKYQMRKVLAMGGVPSPRFELVSISADPTEIACGVSFPCVLKPLSLSASRGVIRANDPKEFVAAFQRIVRILGSVDVKSRKDARAQEILVEDFIPGIEVALEGLLIRGRLKVLAIFDKPDPLDGPFSRKHSTLPPPGFQLMSKTILYPVQHERQPRLACARDLSMQSCESMNRAHG